jgi:hypothetical protein
LFRNTLNTLGSIFRRNFVHFSVVFKGFVFTICSPVKLTPPPAKKGGPSIDWQRCIICQVFTADDAEA